ncbi:hypothetical protein KQ940_07320 [Marinobacterium sp. D7]|uniref:hypothetical protein n=1 Tax=Marinobacterium ramblicola TaxID=2849041 RepID=UPI001C2D013E|nr:hypothetical protein [Marinobacterium ramblicola]MBV1787864.1 hypothetical protein [Marinobacterium ramblicola]
MTAIIDKTPTWTHQSEKGLQINSTAINGDGSIVVYGTSSEFDSGNFTFYACNAEGQNIFAVPISKQSCYQGVFWVAVSEQGGIAAAGGETSKSGPNNGFLQAYAVTTGAPCLLNETLPGRVNQVSLSADGTYLLATFTEYLDNIESGVLQLYQLDNEKTAYQLTDHFSLAGYGFNSCEISTNGTRAAVSAIAYTDDDKTDGKVIAFNVDNGKLYRQSDAALSAGSMRVAVVADGSYWGASLHDGSCALFTDSSTTPDSPLWTYQPPDLDLSLAYGFDITKTAAGKVILAVGVNLAENGNASSQDPLGRLYLVESVKTSAHEAPELLMIADIEYSPNPGVSLDTDANYVTATDGKPADEHSGGNTDESPGNFYLFDIPAKAQLWQYPTKIMNWPMMISANGAAIIGGSDTGELFFWGATG